MLELIDLTKSYADNPVLDHINLSIKPGEIFGMIGKSGAGKSTLLRCLNRLERPDHGQIRMNGLNLCALSAAELRQARHQIGMIFQQFNLLNARNVFDNIALPMRIQGYSASHIQQKVNELLTLVDLADHKHAYPHALSGGQKQRVAIARALATEPQLLLCDEATSALDPENTQSILTLLQTINQHYGITIILITHEMNVVKQICHRVGILNQGRLEEVMALSDVFLYPQSICYRLLHAQLSPQLPTCLTRLLSEKPNKHPLLRLSFKGDSTTGPFISHASRDLGLDISILLANLDRINTLTCGVLIIELHADETQLEAFLHRCQAHQLTVEKLGYVHHSLS